MKNLKYAGIGARKNVPQIILNEIESIASFLENKGYTLVSGGAVGCDTYFDYGVYNPAHKKIYLAENYTSKAMAHACKYHPAWTNLSSYGQMLMARNSIILLGEDLKTPVDFIVCWTPRGAIVGGTGQSLRIAKDMGIPVCNLGIEDFYPWWDNYVQS